MALVTTPTSWCQYLYAGTSDFLKAQVYCYVLKRRRQLTEETAFFFNSGAK